MNIDATSIKRQNQRDYYETIFVFVFLFHL